MVFLRTFPFGTNFIYRDVAQLCSLKEVEIKSIIKELNLDKETERENKYIDKKFFTESQFKKLSINHLRDIVNARINEMVNYVFNENKNLNYINGKILNIYLFFEDDNVSQNLGKLFLKHLKSSSRTTQTELLPPNNFWALSGAAELIFKGWHKEAIPLKDRKKSIISSFFERFF